MKARILVVDAAPSAGQDAIVALGGARPGVNYVAALRSQVPAGFAELDCFVLAAVDGEQLPQGMRLADFDGIAWTGSPLNAYHTDTVVTGQIELAKAAFQSGVPCFGSCWGLQVMTVALGGRVQLNPNGYEFGVARQVRLTAEGRAHAMYDGKAETFDALCVHQDDVCRLPVGAIVLASNEVSAVQAAVVEDGERSFWGVQYHPEFDLAQLSALFRRRAARLVHDGFAKTEADIEQLASDYMALHRDAARRDIAWRYGIGRDVTNADLHKQELANWLSKKVLPRAKKAHGSG